MGSVQVPDPDQQPDADHEWLLLPVPPAGGGEELLPRLLGSRLHGSVLFCSDVILQETGSVQNL